jgi:ribosomal protein S18 acetylase RimI-like enzyme
MKIRYGENKDFTWLIEYDKHISEEILKNKISNKEFYVVEENENLIGWLRYNLFWDSIPFMNMIYFLEKYRKMGFGSKLVMYWEDEMKKKGHKYLMTSTQSNEEAQHFYRKMGYTEIGGFKYLDDPYEIMFFKRI